MQVLTLLLLNTDMEIDYTSWSSRVSNFYTIPSWCACGISMFGFLAMVPPAVTAPNA